MPHKILKLFTLAILIAGASQASAAVYTVVPVDTAGAEALAAQPYFPNTPAQSLADKTNISVFSTEIKQSDSIDNCFDVGAPCNAEKYDVGGAARRGTQGTSLEDTTPYHINNQYINDHNGLESYCSTYLGFDSNLCEIWANNQYFGDLYSQGGLGGLKKKQEAWTNNYYSNVIALKNGAHVKSKADDENGYTKQQIAGLGSIVSTDTHWTTDSILKGIVGEYTFGISSSALFTNDKDEHPRAFEKRGFVNFNDEPLTLLSPVSGDTFVQNMGQTMANDAVETDKGLLVVGSSSFAQSFTQDIESRTPDLDGINIGFSAGVFGACPSNPTPYTAYECQFSTFANEAAFWLIGSDGIITSGVIGSNLPAVDSDHDEVSAQASANAVTLIKGSPVAVGYSSVDTSDSYVMQAAYFTPSDDNDLTKEWIRKFIPGTTITTEDDRNFTYSIANDINSDSVIVGDAKGWGENSQRSFIYDVNEKNLKFLNQVDSSIFFDKANSHTVAINDNNQVIGWVDIENTRGKEARHRAFTYINSTAQGPLKTGGAWMLDDLTNDPSAGVGSLANSYRIHDATGINNAGVIAATASYCQDGYANLSKLAHCNGIEQQQVIVKLVPNANATAADIHPRAKDEDEPLKRSGGSLGILALTALGFIGFRRRK